MKRFMLGAVTIASLLFGGSALAQEAQDTVPPAAQHQTGGDPLDDAVLPTGSTGGDTTGGDGPDGAGPDPDYAAQIIDLKADIGSLITLFKDKYTPSALGKLDSAQRELAELASVKYKTRLYDMQTGLVDLLGKNGQFEDAVTSADQLALFSRAYFGHDSVRYQNAVDLLFGTVDVFVGKTVEGPDRRAALDRKMTLVRRHYDQFNDQGMPTGVLSIDGIQILSGTVADYLKASLVGANSELAAEYFTDSFGKLLDLKKDVLGKITALEKARPISSAMRRDWKAELDLLGTIATGIDTNIMNATQSYVMSNVALAGAEYQKYRADHASFSVEDLNSKVRGSYVKALDGLLVALTGISNSPELDSVKGHEGFGAKVGDVFDAVLQPYFDSYFDQATFAAADGIFSLGAIQNAFSLLDAGIADALSLVDRVVADDGAKAFGVTSAHKDAYDATFGCNAAWIKIYFNKQLADNTTADSGNYDAVLAHLSNGRAAHMSGAAQLYTYLFLDAVAAAKKYQACDVPLALMTDGEAPTPLHLKSAVLGPQLRTDLKTKYGFEVAEAVKGDDHARADELTVEALKLLGQQPDMAVDTRGFYLRMIDIVSGSAQH